MINLAPDLNRKGRLPIPFNSGNKGIFRSSAEILSLDLVRRTPSFVAVPSRLRQCLGNVCHFSHLMEHTEDRELAVFSYFAESSTENFLDVEVADLMKEAGGKV